MNTKISKYESGGILELITISLPIVLSLVSSGIMLLIDRMFLAYYSNDAMTGSVTASMPIWSFQIALLTLTSIASIFVGRFNGAGEYKKLASPVWQMIFFSLATIPFFLLLTYLGASFLFNDSAVKSDAVGYFSWMMPFTPLTLIIGAVSSFFIGKGNTRIVFYASLAGNLTNVVFNTLLIFGVEGLLAPMGANGAAIATLIGTVIQCAVLILVFLSKHNRENYLTHEAKYDPAIMKECLVYGTPAALARFVNILGWAFFFFFISKLGKAPLTVVTITQNMMFFFTFVSQGIGRGVSSVASNAIGSKEYSLLRKVLFSALKLNGILFLVYGIFFQLYPEPFAALFLPDNTGTEGREAILAACVSAALFVWFAVLADSIHWIFMGLLTALGETKLIMWLGSLSLWICAILPIYILVTYYQMPIIYCWLISSTYYLLVSAIYARRFTQVTSTPLQETA